MTARGVKYLRAHHRTGNRARRALTESGVQFATAGTFGLIAVGDLYVQEQAVRARISGNGKFGYDRDGPRRTTVKIVSQKERLGRNSLARRRRKNVIVAYRRCKMASDVRTSTRLCAA
jgi:hypothetical protein